MTLCIVRYEENIQNEEVNTRSKKVNTDKGVGSVKTILYNRIS